MATLETSDRTRCWLLAALLAASVVNALSVSLFGQQIYMLLYAPIGIAIVLYAVLGWKKTEHHIELHDILLLAMLGWAVVATVFAVDVKTSFFGTDHRNDGLYSYFIYAGVYTLARQVRDEKYKKWLFRGFTLMVSVMSVMTFTQVLLGVPGADKVKALYASGLNNINHFAYLLSMAVVAAAGLVYIEKEIARKVLYLVLSAFCMWALIVNGTMGSYLAALFGIVGLAVFMLVRSRDNIKPTIAVVAVLLAVNLFCNLNGSISENFRTSFDGIEVTDSAITVEDTAGSSRVALWKQAVKYIGERPLTGFGPEGLVERYKADGFDNDRPHNEFLQHAVFLGIPALLLYLAALGVLAKNRLTGLKQIDALTLVTGAVVLTYLVSSCFGNTMYYTVVYFFMILGLV